MKTSVNPIALAVALALAGCAVTPAYERPATPVPAAYENAGAAATVDTGRDVQWWHRYNSAELDTLMREALAANHDLAAAVSRIAQARAAARAAGAARLPEVGATASAAKDRHDSATSGSDRAALSVGYEVDLWGGREAGITSAQARVAAAEYRGAAAALILQADVASNYFRILALKDRLAIARENLEAARQLMNLVQVRFDNGAAAALELAQQRTTLLSIQAEIPVLEQSLKQTQHALAILLARAPEGFTVKGASLAELAVPAISTGAPPALLERRPDIRVAEAELVGANADIGAARAALYPSLNLSASAALTGLAAGPSTTVAALAASLAQTIFDGGRRQAQVELTRAARQELTESYVQTVLASLKEVEDSLVAFTASRDRSALVEQAAQQARRAYELARIRYDSGVADLLALLDAQRTRLSSEDNLVQARLAGYTASADLFKALGGGWDAGGMTTTR